MPASTIGSTSLVVCGLSPVEPLLTTYSSLAEVLNSSPAIPLGYGLGVHTPAHEVETLRTIQWDWVAVERVDQQSVIPIGGELVSNEFAVLPDTNNIRDDEDSSILVDVVALGLCGVSSDLAINLEV